MDAALSKLAKKDVPYAKMIPVQKDSDKSEFVEAQDERWVTSLENGRAVSAELVQRLACVVAQICRELSFAPFSNSFRSLRRRIAVVLM